MYLVMLPGIRWILNELKCRSHHNLAKLLLPHGIALTYNLIRFDYLCFVFRDKAHILKYLISKGAKLNSTDDVGDTALHAAIARKNNECVKVLMEHNCDVNIRVSYPPIYTCAPTCTFIGYSFAPITNTKFTLTLF